MILAVLSPASVALFVLGYGLALPIGAQMGKVVRTQSRIALFGHQFGVGIAGVGWLLSGRWYMTALHFVWAVAVRVWFQFKATGVL